MTGREKRELVGDKMGISGREEIGGERRRSRKTVRVVEVLNGDAVGRLAGEH